MTLQVSQEEGQLGNWAQKFRPSEKMIWGPGFDDQIQTMLRLARVIAKTPDEVEALLRNTRVISTHVSKSILLPVVQIKLPDGTVFTMRYNFFNWKLSVEAPAKIEVDFMDLFNPTARVHPIYCEGFAEEWVHGSYKGNEGKFTVDLATKHELLMFFWVYAYHVLGKRRQWRPEE